MKTKNKEQFVLTKYLFIINIQIMKNQITIFEYRIIDEFKITI